ncbi:signal peptidase II [Xanthocytophaga agilis]|uniref:Signal peptidase II n=1 Tax=Xanthocytophaga agilis TaxID=3048010 RepID=A0AAE3UEV2_9BACT|nr:signal peptidase II [Xanthocytophaga agilis]MDJ1500687.1 signal peptidase II [Xanthocytophaga agilis]
MLKGKEWQVLIGIVIFDLLTKIVAACYLPYQEDVFVIGNKISLYLTYNDGPTGAQAEALLNRESNPNLVIILSSVNALIWLSYFLFIRKKALKMIYKVLIGIAVFFMGAFLIGIAQLLLANVFISSWYAAIVAKIVALLLYGTFFSLARNQWIRYFLILILACGIGNLLSLFYPPFNVIDFINVKGSYELLRIGVFNFADLSFDIGVIGIIASWISMLIHKVRYTYVQSN